MKYRNTWWTASCYEEPGGTKGACPCPNWLGLKNIGPGPAGFPPWLAAWALCPFWIFFYVYFPFFWKFFPKYSKMDLMKHNLRTGVIKKVLWGACNYDDDFSWGILLHVSRARLGKRWEKRRCNWVMCRAFRNFQDSVSDLWALFARNTISAVSVIVAKRWTLLVIFDFGWQAYASPTKW